MLQPDEEITVERIDFDWVAAQTKPKNLKYAFKVLKDDGKSLVEK